MMQPQNQKVYNQGRSQTVFCRGKEIVFDDKRGRVSLFKGVVKRKILLYAAVMRFCFKVHTLMPYFESSTTTEMLIRYNCCQKVTGRVQKLLLLLGKNL